ncbi:MAG TPA: precorrin-6A synthase (deacetylating) [Phycicoccus elongatus]|uniref:precorrin-6A synthase (deacetylating) n=1 Tax=Phycicoccus elongatus TaxID=101689 RepID=UPI002CDFA3AC|nr:precorrin-6A synthase (deacetylating) [Phycicoccus elongatus]HPK12447.1 precorrin-6A synthase (deacetylating) [Phycicoccus elongatus]
MSPHVAPRQVKVIGIGAGSPGHLTQEAIAALRSVDVFLVADKGAAKDELVSVRRAICAQFVDGTEGEDYRFVTVTDPVRGPDAERDDTAYRSGVADWHAARADRYADVIADLPDDAVVGFLVWGDPAFYDSTIRVVDAIGERLPIDMHVVPGISAFQALAAAHGIVLHAVGQPVHITTGRRLAAEWSPALGSVVVMLDGHLACQALVERAPDLVIHWGAYLGLPQQTLRSGRLADVIDDLIALRAELRAEHGWIMDVYLLSPS